MTIEFVHSGLWQRLKSFAQKAKRRYAAVAFLGAGAFEMLPLESGDLLVVDLSLPSVRSGQTNPYEVEKYIKNGVEVHSRAHLHAKVFVFDTRVVVGSANASHNSRDNLVETAIVTNNKEIVRAARGFVFSLRGEYVTPAYLKACKRKTRNHALL